MYYRVGPTVNEILIRRYKNSSYMDSHLGYLLTARLGL